MKINDKKALLFIGSIIGVAATAVVSAICTSKANKHLEEECSYALESKPEKEDPVSRKIDYAKFVVKETWKYHIPTMCVAAGTMTCIVAGKKMDAKTIATLTAMSSSSMYLVNQYRAKIREYADEEVLSTIDKEIASERKELPGTPVHAATSDKTYIKDEAILMYDKFTDTWFETTRLAFTTAAMCINQQFAYGSQAPLKMFYDMQGANLPEAYEDCKWDWEDFNDGYIWIEFYHEPRYDKNGCMYYELTYNIDPYGVNEEAV